MRQLTQLLPSFNNVAISSTATSRLPRNRRYHGIFLQYKTNAVQATIESDISEIRLKINGKVVRQFSAKQLNAINAFNGYTFQAGMIPIWLAEPRRRTPEGEEYLSWLVYEQLGIGDLDIEVDIAAGAVSPTLSGIMVFDYERPADQFADPTLRTVMHWLRRVTACGAAFTAASPLTPANFFPSVAGWLHRIHSTDAVVTQKILRNGATPVWNLTTVQAPAIYQPYGLALQNGVFSLALDADTQYVNGLPIQTVPDLAIDFVTSGAATGSQFISIIELRKPFDLS